MKWVEHFARMEDNKVHKQLFCDKPSCVKCLKHKPKHDFKNVLFFKKNLF